MLDARDAATMRLQIAIFPHPLDACSRFFAVWRRGKSRQVSEKSSDWVRLRLGALALSI